MRTYGDLFRVPEFKALFSVVSLQIAASTISGLALGVLVYTATSSPLLSALSMFGPSFAQMIGALALLSAADRLPPRAAMIALALTFALGTAAVAIPGLPVWAIFAIIFLLGLAASIGGGVRFGLLNEILPKDGYLLGRSTINMSVGIQQIVGYAIGGLLVTFLAPALTLLTGASLYLLAAATARLGLTARPPRATGRPSIPETWRTNRVLWSSGSHRSLYLALWVPNGLIVGCESLFVAFDPAHAGVLFAFAAFGMLLGDIAAGRFLPPHWRVRLGAPLRLLLAIPYLIFFLHPSLPFAVAAVALASIGFSASLLLQERLLALTPESISGQALGLQSAGLTTMQGVGAALAGTIAQLTTPATAMGVMACASVIVTLLLAAGLRSAYREVAVTQPG
ncbi:MFS transporter [Acrocarpospora macrocephala]|uniref:Membrane protein n=1 Tax=Acrocarpospora macrocephala TaxID=150177 RepID=A0A5M3X2Q9_9ACTN|nr:MFS transporter [Acrocarpospora macrocephala]GES13103.1 membrane protein [Acrocarpospora macrocephala]